MYDYNIIVDIYVEYTVVECRGLYRLVSVPVVAPLALAWYISWGIIIPLLVLLLFSTLHNNYCMVSDTTSSCTSLVEIS